MDVSTNTSATNALPPAQVYLLDSHGLVFQMFHGIPQMNAADGRPTNAVFGVTRSLLDLYERGAEYLLAVFGELAALPGLAEFAIGAPRVAVLPREIGLLQARNEVEKTGAKVNIEDDGTVKVASNDGEAMKAAIKWIKSIASDPEVGQIYDGTVVKVMEFGAFVNFFGPKDGLVHISQLAASRVQKTSDVVKEGDKVKVKLLGFDDRGKTRLSMRVVDQATGEDLEAKQKAEAKDAPAPAAGE